jgi:hypothetical protein
MVASSGAGKSAYLSGIDRIMMAVLGSSIRLEPPGTPEGLMAAACRRNFGLISVPEGARLLQPAIGTPADGILAVLESVWANESMRGKTNRGDSIDGVDMCLFSVLLQMTCRQFDQILDNEEVASGGFASRTSWGKESKNATDNNNEVQVPIPDGILYKLKALTADITSVIQENEYDYQQRLSAATGLRAKEVKRNPIYMVPDEQLHFGYGAKELFLQWKDEFKAEQKTFENQPCLQSMYVRQAEKILREATLVSIYEQWEQPKKFVTKEAMLKVRSFNDKLLAETKEHFNVADSGSEVEKLCSRIMHKLSEMPIIKQRDLRNVTKGRYKTPKCFEMAINQLVEDGQIVMERSIGQNGAKVSFVKLVEKDAQ